MQRWCRQLRSSFVEESQGISSHGIDKFSDKVSHFNIQTIFPLIKMISFVMAIPILANIGIPLCMHTANERRCYNVTLVGHMHEMIPVRWSLHWNRTLGWGLLSQFLPLRCFSEFFSIVKIHVSYWISHLYLTGVTAAELRWHLPNINVIQII